MGIDLNGTTLTSSGGLVATYASNQVMKMSTTGVLKRYNLGQPMFRAGRMGAVANITIGTASTWVALPGLNATNVNVDTCYNTTNGRFTAPVNGIYLFTTSQYCIGQAAGWYIYHMFWVNGSSVLRRPSADGTHRIDGHGHTNGYNCDTEMLEIMSLEAGDYVQVYHYCGAAANLHVGVYGRFEGYLLG